MTEHASVPMGRLIAVLALFVVVGTPLVAYLWETVNLLLSGNVVATRLLLSIPLLLLFLGMLVLLARTVGRIEAAREERAGTT